MKCPICDYRKSKIILKFKCESFDNSYLYKNVKIVKCKNCGHSYNKLRKKELDNLEKYYQYEHPFTDRFDKVDNTIILNHFLEHFVELKTLMKIIKTLLNDNGLCKITVPDVDYYNNIYFYILREHIQHFNFKTLKLLANNSGFEVIKHEKTDSNMVGTLKSTNISIVLKPKGTTYCWGIGREFMYLYPNTRLKDLDLILIDDTPEKQKLTFKGMKIHSSNILKEASKDSFLIITAIVHKEILKKKALELGYKGEIIDV